MISFTSFLAEARMAPLYHSTSPSNMLTILEEGFRPTTFHRSRKLLMVKSKHHSGVEAEGISFSGISFTRNPRFAKRWSKGEGWYFEVDQLKLSQRYKILPVQYWQVFRDGKHHEATKARYSGETHGDNEYEEFVLSAQNIPPSFITKIYYRSETSANNNYLGRLQKKVVDKNLNIEFVEY
jgi:hypothetical protein